MKQIPAYSISEAKKYNLEGGVCYLYPDSPTERLSCALVEQDGRYPKEGFRQNETCTEAMFIIEGTLEFTLHKNTFTATKNSVIYIPPKTPYSIHGKGKVFVFIEPKWNSNQNTQV